MVAQYQSHLRQTLCLGSLSSRMSSHVHVDVHVCCDACMLTGCQSIGGTPSPVGVSQSGTVSLRGEVLGPQAQASILLQQSFGLSAVNPRSCRFVLRGVSCAVFVCSSAQWCCLNNYLFQIASAPTQFCTFVHMLRPN